MRESGSMTPESHSSIWEYDTCQQALFSVVLFRVESSKKALSEVVAVEVKI